LKSRSIRSAVNEQWDRGRSFGRFRALFDCSTPDAKGFSKKVHGSSSWLLEADSRRRRFRPDKLGGSLSRCSLLPRHDKLAIDLGEIDLTRWDNAIVRLRIASSTGRPAAIESQAGTCLKLVRMLSSKRPSIERPASKKLSLRKRYDLHRDVHPPLHAAVRCCESIRRNDTT
jgi:hypothetical protein